MTKKIATIALLLALCYPLTQAAYAAGTPSGTDISNTATATYNDGATPVTKTASAPNIVVDNKVNLTVTKNGDATVLPGSTDQALVFSVKNEGNTTQRYALDATNSAGIVMDNVRIFLDNGTTPGVLDAGDTLYVNAATFGDVDADDSLAILIIADTPAGAVSGDISDYQLVATTVDAGTTTVTTATVGPNTAGVDVIFADNAGSAAGDTTRDGKHSSEGTYTVNLLSLVLNKSVVITWDPTNLFVTPKAIPGAILTYSIKASITGVGTAADVVITDEIPDNSTYVVSSLKLNGAPLSDGADLDVGSVAGAPVTVTVGLGDLTNASPEQTITFDVTIN
ncbi:MAG: hypothetical protein CVU69_03840 [Deltaproteobacteria bacterium HGW-Deltaproteobacteria-4]|nr:MAG: hypothetical protein CVU69_03840 [Deltaproteobacteria bacterium HGW-Deltaproteobacteria-4]